MKRIAKIIERAEKEFNYVYNPEDSLQSIIDGATKKIIACVIGNERFCECEHNEDYTHFTWHDSGQMLFEFDGPMIMEDKSENLYYRRHPDGTYERIEWYEATENDYVHVCNVLDSEARKVALLCR